ncbi:MAG: porin family protein [Bacteroidales bacterium]|nr:porin family protein [Bacteroidales bacterium]
MRTLKFVALFLMAIFVKNTNAQIVEKGSKLIDVYYGWPNLWSHTAKTTLTNDNSYQIEIGSIGPMGARLEYLASDKVGVGIEFNYSNTSVSWRENSSDGNGNNVTYHYKVTIPRYRAMFCFNFHFGGSENFDAYGKLAAGYGSWAITYSTNDPTYNDDRINFNLIPISIRTAIGARYFISDNFHINAELGLGGGPLMAFGIGTKF